MRRLSCALIFFLFLNGPVWGQSLPWMDSFTDNDLAGWTFMDDEPSRDGPGLWQVDDQALRQTSNIFYGLTPEEEYAKFLGTHIHAGNPEWKDYSFNCLMRSEDDDGIGILFRYRDARNYYRLILLDDANNRGPFTRLQKYVDGVMTTLQETQSTAKAIPVGWFSVTADVRQDSIKIYLNGSLLFNTTDAAFSSGGIGFMCYANSGAHFDSVRVTSESLVYEKPVNVTPIVQRLPYIQSSTQHSVQIAWRSSAAAIGAVEYGETLDYGATVQEDSLGWKHWLTLTGLEPDTRYFYRVTNNGAVVTEGDTFRTARPVSDRRASFLIWGDSGTGSATQYGVAALMEQQPVDFCLHVGDVSQSNGSEYDNIFFKPYKNIVKSRPVFTSIGNHDTYFDQAATYQESFYLPHNNPDSTERWYSFNWGHVHCIALDSNVDFSIGSPQYTWLVDDLNSELRRQTTWTMIYFHHPPYSVGWDVWAGDTRVQQILQPLFETQGVDMVFNGHTHDYERGYLNGVYWIITGGGGGGLDVWGRDYSHVAKDIYEFHYTRVDVVGDSLRLRAVSINNQIIDDLRIRKGDPPPLEPDEKTERETNDAAASATIMAVGDTLSATFSSAADVDWFKFKLQATHLYYFTSFASTPTQLEPDLALYYEGDYETNLLNAPVRGRNNGGDFRLAGFLAQKTGFYYAKISNPLGVTGSYRLRLVGGRGVQSFFQHEPDNTLAQAGLRPHLASGDTLDSAIFPADDKDWYRLTGQAGQAFELGVIPLQDLAIRDVDTFVSLLDSNGTVLAVNDDRGLEVVSFGENMNNTFSVITGVFPYTGAYYLAVECYYTSTREGVNDANPGVGEYRVVFTSQQGASVNREELAVPAGYALHANYPNPFNQSTALSFDLPRQERVVVEVLDLLGRRVALICQAVKPAGRYRLQWNGADQMGRALPSGLYWARLSAGSFSQTIKMMLLR